MKKNTQNHSLLSWEYALIGTEETVYRENFEFNLQKSRIDSIVNELYENLELFFQVHSGIQLSSDDLKLDFETKILHLLNFGIDYAIQYLKEIQIDNQFQHYEISEKYLPVLEAVQTLYQLVPTKDEILLPYYHQRTETEKRQWIAGILINKAKVRSLQGSISFTQNAIDKTKLELFVQNERSPREIQDIIEQSELRLMELKLTGDREFIQLQENTSNIVLDLEQHKEYRDLIDTHSQKRRKITKLTVQLQLWIKQYDKFVGEPMKDLLALETELEEFPEWKAKIYDPQEERLNQLMFNVDLFEAELTEELIENFRIEHAARIIQRGWRRVLAKKRAKKKGRKGKSKRKGKKKSAIP
ncbi:uncharacterized protein LOC131440152 [Malaya genurostris]|uniref:uncharacterized protein LOC131440152 n=1 Tax=Malaya genurostris TaxID=325434 RepID=UPI0026F3D9B1|nr:uncharacterized protein LOC131440152 [Malaya genurostris]